MTTEAVQVLEIRVHDVRVGYLTGTRSGHNIFTVSPEYIELGPTRPTLSLSLNRLIDDHSSNDSPLRQRSQQQLPPWFSNLLPEGALRKLLSEQLRIHEQNEFPMLAALGEDLPGAVTATLMEPDLVPAIALEGSNQSAMAAPGAPTTTGGKFSLAGVQIKFSMKRRHDRFTMLNHGEAGDWIIKTPSTVHPFVPANEYSAMKLAEAAGISIPDIALVPLEQLENLPELNLPQEHRAYAVKRFDRDQGNRVHAEDMAQVMNLRPGGKYGNTNYETIARILDRELGSPALGIRGLVQRLMVNILLANGDAHLKNWSLIYPDQRTPELAPAYDLVFTQPYVEGEDRIALNLVQNKRFYTVSEDHWRRFARKTQLDEKLVLRAVGDVVEAARTTWRSMLPELPMAEDQKENLIRHWSRLHPDFRI